MISGIEKEEEGQKAKSNCGCKSKEERAGQKRDRGPLTMNRTPKPPKVRLNPFRNHRKSLPKDRAPHHSLSQSPRVLAHYSPLLSALCLSLPSFKLASTSFANMWASPPHPADGPHRLRRRRGGRRLEGIVVASSVGIVVSQAPACSPETQERAGRALAEVQVALCCQPCSPWLGLLFVTARRRVPSTIARQDGLEGCCVPPPRYESTPGRLPLPPIGARQFIACSSSAIESLGVPFRMASKAPLGYRR